MDARIFAKTGVANRHVTDGTFGASSLAYRDVVSLNGASRTWPVAGPGFGGAAKLSGAGAAVATSYGVAANSRGMRRQRMQSSLGSRQGKIVRPAVRTAMGRRRDGEIIAADSAIRSVILHLGDAELADRGQNCVWRKTKLGCGALWLHAHFVGPAVITAAAHSGVLEETYVHADI